MQRLAQGVYMIQTVRRVAQLALVAVVALGCCGCAGTSGAASSSSETTSAQSASASAGLISSNATDEKSSLAVSDVPANSFLQGQAGVDPELAKQIEQAIAPLVEQAPMLVGVSVIDLPTTTSAGINDDTPFVAASMIKLVVAETFLTQAKTGAVSLDGVYTLQESDIVGGTGSFGGRGAGAQATYRELLFLMISESDNVATNIIIDAVGMDAINAEAKRLGLTATQVNRHMMDTDAIAAGVENYVSAHDIAYLLALVHDGRFVNKESSELVLSALEEQIDQGGIVFGLPDGTAFAHKTGALSDARHDGGIVEGTHPYVIVVLCGGEGFSASAAEALMADIARVVHATLVG